MAKEKTTTTRTRTPLSPEAQAVMDAARAQVKRLKMLEGMSESDLNALKAAIDAKLDAI